MKGISLPKQIDYPFSILQNILSQTPSSHRPQKKAAINPNIATRTPAEFSTFPPALFDADGELPEPAVVPVPPVPPVADVPVSVPLGVLAVAVAVPVSTTAAVVAVLPPALVEAAESGVKSTTVPFGY
jgi:hypothetical protein